MTASTAPGGLRRPPTGRLLRVLGPVATFAVLAGACGSNGTDTAGPLPATYVVTTTIATTTTATTMPTTTTTVDPGTLAQTDEKPTPAGPLWDAGTKALWQAVVTDDPAKALPFFFPLTAYRQVKGISDPDHDYQTRLIPLYEKDIHKLHGDVGTTASSAQFVGVEPGPAPAWIKPGVEYNKGAYWRVLDNRIVYTVAGQRRTLPLVSMISWRGQWYVVHLGKIP